MASFLSQGARLGDLMRLVANDAAEPHRALETSFDWEHSRALEIAKWSLAGATAIFGVVAAGFLRAAPVAPQVGAAAAKVASSHWEDTLDWAALALVLAGVLLASGLLSLWLASRIQRRYLTTLALLARFIEIRPFLMRAEEETGIEF